MSAGCSTAAGAAGYQTVARNAWVFAPRQLYDLSAGVNVRNVLPTLNWDEKDEELVSGFADCPKEAEKADASRHANSTTVRQLLSNMSPPLNDYSRVIRDYEPAANPP